jgi:hypothetical protein
MGNPCKNIIKKGLLQPSLLRRLAKALTGILLIIGNIE